MRTAVSITAGLLAVGTGLSVSAAAPEGDGFSVQDGGRAWPRWQARLIAGVPAAAWRAAGPGGQAGQGLRSRGLSVMGDYYFGPSLATRPGGFRATTGLLVGARTSLFAMAGGSGDGLQMHGSAGQGADAGLQTAGWPPAAADTSAETTAVPYLGVGYSAASPKGGFSFSADLGLMALTSSSGIKFGRVAGAAQNLDDTLRDMRLSPVLQLGVSYSF